MIATLTFTVPALPKPPAGFTLSEFYVAPTFGSGYQKPFKLNEASIALTHLIEKGICNARLVLVALDDDGIDSRSCTFDTTADAWGAWRN